MMPKLRELVAADPDIVHARGGDGQTPLHFASTVEVAEFLLANGAEIDARDMDHESTPRNTCCVWNRSGIIRGTGRMWRATWSHGDAGRIS